MKIAALVDLTPLCKKAVEWAGFIAEYADAELVLVHVASHSTSDESITQQLKPLCGIPADKVRVETHVARGDFFSVIPTEIDELNVDLVVIPTHGKVGLKQNLFGANILKLVKILRAPSLVVQEGTPVSAEMLRRVLFPIGPHDNFHLQIEQTAALAKLFESEVVIYTVRNDIRGVDEKLRVNIQAAKDLFSRKGIKHEAVSEAPSSFSAGYSKHILAFAKKHGLKSVSMMANVSEDNAYIGNYDKENIILNADALPVLCANG